MTDQDQIKLYKDQIERTIDVNRVLTVILRKWYIILITVLASLSISYIQLRYTKPLYTSSIQLKFEDDKGNQIGDLFKYGRLSGRIDNQLKTEGEIFKSRALALKTLQRLNYQVSYWQQGQVVTSELYPFTYFKVEPLFIDSADFGRTFMIRFKDERTYQTRFSEKGTSFNHSIEDSLLVGSSIFKVSVANPKRLSPVINQDIIIRIHSPIAEAGKLGGNIEVEMEKGTSILSISYVSEIPEKAADFVNATAQTYIQESVNSRAKAAEQTITFIEGLIIDLANQVNNAQKDLTNFQETNSGIELDKLGQSEFGKITNLETEKKLLELKQRMLQKLEQQLASKNTQTIELVLLDPEDAQELPRMLELLNILIMDRLSLSMKTQPGSPVMIENEKKISEVKSALNRALVSVRNKLNEKIKFTDQNLTEAKQKLTQLPAKQQALLNLERTFKVNEKIYGYLMEKKLETRIGKSSILPNASFIDPALPPSSPFHPVPGRVYAIAFMIGLALGIGIIFLLRFIYNRIPDKETIEGLSNTPVIGVIKKLEEEEMNDQYELYIMRSPKSVFSESVRGIRTNINFLLQGQKNKIICVTSSVSGEGKTFTTVNLAASLTMLGYKVMIVGCDLRRPKIHLTFRNMTNDIGLTTYLIGKHNLEQIIQHSEFENLDVITAGPTPPNPSELLQTQTMDDLVQHLKNTYDFVFFDTAPVGLVSDSFSLMTKADLNLFIIRSQYSRRDFALIPDRLKEDNDIPNLYTILNSYDSSSAFYGSVYKSAYGGYYGGGGYYYYGGYYNRGYGYYARKYYTQYYTGYYSDDITPQPWWKKLNPFSRKRKKKSKNAY